MKLANFYITYKLKLQIIIIDCVLLLTNKTYKAQMRIWRIFATFVTT